MTKQPKPKNIRIREIDPETAKRLVEGLPARSGNTFMLALVRYGASLRPDTKIKMIQDEIALQFQAELKGQS